MPELRSDQAAIHVTVEGSGLDKNVWNSMEGGDIEVSGIKSRAGGMGEEEPLGGPRSRTDCTVTRRYTNDVLHPLVPVLERLAGNAAMSVSWTPLDGDGNKDGDTHGISGMLIGTPRTKRDAEQPGVMYLTLTMSCSSAPTVIS